MILRQKPVKQHPERARIMGYPDAPGFLFIEQHQGGGQA